MKTLTNLLKLVLVAPVMLLQLNCGSSGSTGTTSGLSYYTSNGVCYSSAGTAVSTSYCSSALSSGYYLSNGNCYQTSTGQIVSTTYCSSSLTGTTSTSCVGAYYWCPYGISYGLTACQQGYCSGTNCRGYTLYTSSLTPVTCQ